MTGLLKSLWNDERGAVLSAEAVMLGTVGVLGATAGANMVADSVNSEMQDFAYAIRHLDQSYCYSGFSSPHACVAGSSFEQEDIAVSIQELGEIQRREGKVDRKHREKQERQNRDERPRKKSKKKQDASTETSPAL